MQKEILNAERLGILRAWAGLRLRNVVIYPIMEWPLPLWSSLSTINNHSNEIVRSLLVKRVDLNIYNGMLALKKGNISLHPLFKKAVTFFYNFY
jgi:hypothetical protein